MKSFNVLAVLFLVNSIHGDYEQDLVKFSETVVNYGCRQVTVIENGSSYNMIFSNMLAAEGSAIVYNAARGKTASALASNIGLPDLATTNDFLGDLHIRMRNTPSGHPWFRSRHDIFVSSKYDISDSFNDTVSKLYGANVHTFDLSNVATATQTMNELIASDTADIIQEALPPNALKEEYRMVHVTGIHYRGHWNQTFDPRLTAMKPFHLSPNETIQVPMMTLVCGLLEYYEDYALRTRFLVLQFHRPQIDFLLQLPMEIDGLAQLETQLHKTVGPPLVKTKVRVMLPMFQIRTTTDVKSIDDQLKRKRGLFEPGNGDLSGMAGEAGEIGQDLFYQQAYIRVNEAGIVVQGDTVADSNRCIGDVTDIKEYVVDRPFRFQIRRFGIIVAAGRVVNPITPPETHEVHPNAFDFQ